MCGYSSTDDEKYMRHAIELAKKGFAYDESSAKYKNGRMTVAYLKDEFGGFAVHLLQK